MVISQGVLTISLHETCKFPGVQMVTMAIHGQGLRVAAGRACVQGVEEVATNMVTRVA